MDLDEKPNNDMRAEYDFSNAERGKFYRPSSKRPKLTSDIDASQLPPPEEMIRQGRLERDVQIFMALGDDLLRPIASKHGVNWDELDEDEREQFLRKLFDEE